MSHSRCRLCFAHESLPCIVIVSVLLGKELERDEAIQLHVPRQINDPLGPTTKSGDNGVMGHDRAGEPVWAARGCNARRRQCGG
jgi:hypothetical protein